MSALMDEQIPDGLFRFVTKIERNETVMVRHRMDGRRLQMNRKTAAILVEIIPILSAAVTFPLILSSYDSDLIRRVSSVTMLLAFLGFLFFIYRS